MSAAPRTQRSGRRRTRPQATTSGRAAARRARRSTGDGRFSTLGHVVGMVGSALTSELQRRIPKADLDERDPDYIRENLPFLWLLSTFYFRGEVRGIENIPAEGGVLLVGNHSGGNMIPDTYLFSLAFCTHFGVERRFYQLAHNLVLVMPGLGFLRKYGVVAASRENARAALASGSALLVYPGGDWETHRPSWQSAKIDFAGRKGFIELALAEDVPIVPVVSIGGQETALFLSRGERLAQLLRLDKMFRLKVLPINISVPWGLVIGDFQYRLPLPAKITIQVLPPIHLREQFGQRPNVTRIYDHVTGSMQETLDRLAAERRLPLLG